MHTNSSLEIVITACADCFFSFQNLRKHCDDKQVSHAHELMKSVAHNIDQVKKKLEQQSRVKELAGIVDGWLGPDLSVLGELRQEGLLSEHAKPRVVLLFQTMLIITKPKEDKRLQFRAYIPVCLEIIMRIDKDGMDHPEE